jgi:hypothetical protein
MWEFFYGNDGVLLKLNNLPFYISELDGTYIFLPKLGNAVSEEICKEACKKAQKSLNKVGYMHIDLYTEDYHNCTNVRELNGNYYPIDMLKIIPIAGGKKTKRDKPRNKSRRRRMKFFKN